MPNAFRHWAGQVGKEVSAARAFGDNNELVGFGRIEKKVVGAGQGRCWDSPWFCLSPWFVPRQCRYIATAYHKIFATITYQTPLGFSNITCSLGWCWGQEGRRLGSIRFRCIVLFCQTTCVNNYSTYCILAQHWQALIHLLPRPCFTGHRNAVRLHPVNHFDLFSESGTLAHAVPQWHFPPMQIEPAYS